VTDKKTAVVLLVEDDPEDQWAAKAAFSKLSLKHTLRVVDNGQSAVDYLFRREEYADPASSPRPDLILLDLNLPGKNGLEVLRQVKSDADLRRIPIVVLTTSSQEEDVVATYDSGVNSFLTKPVDFEQLLEVIGGLGRYWLELVHLPPR